VIVLLVAAFIAVVMVLGGIAAYVSCRRREDPQPLADPADLYRFDPSHVTRLTPPATAGRDPGDWGFDDWS